MAHRRLGALYARSFERRPWLTLAIANGTLGALADTLAQSFERYKKEETGTANIKVSADGSSRQTTTTGYVHEETRPWDLARTGRFAAFGIGMAPLLAEWNRWIEHRFPLRLPTVGTSVAKVSLAALAKRVAVDQLAFAPFGLACFVGGMGIMEGRDSLALRQKFDEIYMPALLANWQLWPLVQTINFRFMPLRYRVPFTGAVGIAWQVFLSVLNSSRSKADSGPVEHNV